ncbi:MAG: DUF5107 domain-containing protein [Armatimonadota bacterium]|nr:MAG: DUF5107 domain-containing protein [Armatimonadota bacterium]
MSVEIRDESLELPTYAWGPPDPNPAFQRRSGRQIYPYPLLDDIRDESRPVQYRALVLENKYLRVTVLPELGGRLYSAIDKPTGEEIFYRNNVVKPGLIGLRGAWISGGIEWNFPRGHTVTTVSPIDAKAVRGEDGSATVWVGNIEQVHRMSWQVGIRLRPDTALIETEIRLENRTALPHPYYFWANAAVPARDDMRLIYPGTRAFTWSTSDITWPVHDGRDLSRYTAFEGANDVFIVDSLEDFFGVYYEERDFGVVHFASVHDSLGKKFFTWGTAHHGKMWSAALSDDDGPYCEIQSGRFVDQGSWRLMPAHHCERWTEWWYPVKRIGGPSWANREAAVGIARRDGSVEYGAAVTRRLPKALLCVRSGDSIIREHRTDLAPDRPLRAEIPKGEDLPPGPLTLSLLDADGREIIRYAEDHRPRTSRFRPEPNRRDSTPGELLRSALRSEEAGDAERAWELRERALSQDQGCTEAAVALGRSAIERLPEEAVGRLAEAVAAAPESAEAAYYLGVALARAGEDDDAEAPLWSAARSPAFAHAARVEIGLIALRGGDWKRAADVLRSSLQYRADGALARSLLAAALRRAGRLKEALAEVQALRSASPLDRLGAAEAHFCAAAEGRPRIAARHLRDLSQMMPREPDPWLDVALHYAAAGLLDEAAALLSWATDRIPAAKRDPLGHYLLAHCLGRLGKEGEASAARSRASQLSPEHVFPHHWEMEAVLRDRLENDPSDAAARYYLGSLLYGRDRRREALAEWQKAANNLSEFSVLHRNLALAHREVNSDLAAAEEALHRAVKSNASDARLYLELNDVMRERGSAASDRLAMLDSAPAGVGRRGTIAAQQVACCLALEEWDRAVSLLRNHTFHRWEMEFRMRALYLESYLGRGIARFDGGDLQGAREDFEQALAYPENIRIGRPARPNDARAHWCAAVVCEALGDRAAAGTHWEAAAAESHHHAGTELALYRALSLKKLGRAPEAAAILDEALDVARSCAEQAPDDATAQFSLGLVLRAMDKLQEAESHLRQAVELDSGMRRAHRLLDKEVIL